MDASKSIEQNNSRMKTTHIRRDRISKKNEESEMLIPIGHFVIVNRKKYKKKYPIIRIHGLGSCISLILLDTPNKIFAMTHILLPSSDVNISNTIRFPQKYANLAVKDLVAEIKKEGACLSNLQAILVGGSKIFRYSSNHIGEENAKVIREELQKQKIKIIKEDIGGSKGRNVLFDVGKMLIMTRKTGQNEFIILYREDNKNEEEK
ncbi:MAG: chemotaxis protein CheD [Promethearchaeota archaeon]